MKRPLLLATVALAMGLFAAVGWWLAMMGTATPAGAATLCAPAASYSIQDAIDDAGDGDTVRIVYGTWHETLVITEDITLQGGWNKDCTVQTYTDPSYTVIDGDASGSVVCITDGSEATLESLTLTNGQAQKGGGVYVLSASPTLSNVVVTSNVISPTGSSLAQAAYGGGVFVHNGTITLTDSDITFNTSHPSHSGYCFGGGLALYGPYGAEGKAVLEGTCILSNTNPSDSQLHAGGLYLHPYSQVTSSRGPTT